MKYFFQFQLFSKVFEKCAIDYDSPTDAGFGRGGDGASDTDDSCDSYGGPTCDHEMWVSRPGGASRAGGAATVGSGVGGLGFVVGSEAVDSAGIGSVGVGSGGSAVALEGGFVSDARADVGLDVEMT